MITTPSEHTDTEPQAAVDTVESVKLDEVTGGWWYPPYGPSPYGPSPYGAYGYAPYSPRYAAAMENRAQWWAANAPPAPRYNPYWRPWY